MSAVTGTHKLGHWHLNPPGLFREMSSRGGMSEKAKCVCPQCLDALIPISAWGAACGRGFVSNSRFGDGPVITRTNRKSTRAWRKIDSDRKGPK